MVVTSSESSRHQLDLEEFFNTLGKYQLKLNSEKYMLEVKVGKFLGVLLTERGIKANPNKCSTIINMRSLTNVKEVQSDLLGPSNVKRLLSS